MRRQGIPERRSTRSQSGRGRSRRLLTDRTMRVFKWLIDNPPRLPGCVKPILPSIFTSITCSMRAARRSMSAVQGRYAAHLKFARKELARNSQVEKNAIIVKMLDAGIEPGFRKIAEGISQDEGHALERAEIARLGSLGTGPLANNHDGGAQGGSNRSALRAAWRGSSNV